MFEIAKIFQQSFFIDKALAPIYQREQLPIFQKITLDEKRLLYSTFRHALPISLYLDLLYPKWRKKNNSRLGFSFFFLALEERIFGRKALYHTYQWLNKRLSESRTEWLKPIARSILEKAPQDKDVFYKTIDHLMRAEPYVGKLLSYHPTLQWPILFEHPPLWIRCKNENTLAQIPVEDIVSQHKLALKLKKTSSTTRYLFEQGEISFQNISSIYFEEIFKTLSQKHMRNPKHIIETCAAPGGKSTLLLNHFMNDPSAPTLCLTELNPGKAQDLENNLLRIFPQLYKDFSGLKIQVHDWLKGPLGQSADLIFVDAPCSGSGVTRKHPDVLWKEPYQRACEHAHTQYTILSHALKNLNNGGCLTYSTCSLDFEENEEIVRRLCQEHADLNVIATECSEGIALEFGHQILPTEAFDGLYIAILKKS